MAWRPSDTQRGLAQTARIEQLRRIYLKAQGDMTRRLSSIDLTSFQRYRTEQLLSQINSMIDEIDVRAYNWAKRSVKHSYRSGVNYGADHLRRMKVVRSVKYDALIHRQAVDVLTDAVATDLLEINGVIRRNVSRYIRATQQRIIEDRNISKALAESALHGEARRSTSDRLLSQFRKRMEAGEFIEINGRKYRPETYSELVARTRMREASSQGTVNTCLQYGNDLVQVSIHQDIDGDDICNEYEGRIFSLSGTSKTYPMLDHMPPFHPNCRHVLLPITEEAAERRSKQQ